MSPPEIWGPPVWILFHTLAEKLNENVYSILSKSLFNQIVRICKYLPCPECSSDATNFLAKIKPENLKTKESFRHMLYLFHNYVNLKKRKGLFNYLNVDVYKNYRLVIVINNFIKVYNTKGNMKMLSESFQRQFVINEFKSWISHNLKYFIQQNKLPNNPINPPNDITASTSTPQIEINETIFILENNNSLIETHNPTNIEKVDKETQTNIEDTN